MQVESNPETAPPSSITKAAASFFSDRDINKWIVIGVGVVVLVLLYLNSLQAVAGGWRNPQYSHGYLIPIFAAVLLWIRRESFEEPPVNHIWLGVGLMVLSVLFRVVGTRFVVFTVDNLSFITCILSLFIVVGGLASLRWAAAPVSFLIFMFPLPGFLVDSILRPLQTFATHSSTFALQTLGVEAYRVGNKINLDHMELGVIDQCSGLRMLTIFIALATAIAMIFTHRPMWERLVLVASAVPIAILVNVIRITITGVLYNLQVDSEIANHIFKNWAGYIMMPMALGLLFLVMQVLSQLVVETSQLPPTSRNVSHVSGVQRPLGANPVGRSGKTV